MRVHSAMRQRKLLALRFSAYSNIREQGCPYLGFILSLLNGCLLKLQYIFVSFSFYLSSFVLSSLNEKDSYFLCSGIIALTIIISFIKEMYKFLYKISPLVVLFSS